MYNKPNGTVAQITIEQLNALKYFYGAFLPCTNKQIIPEYFDTYSYS